MLTKTYRPSLRRFFCAAVIAFIVARIGLIGSRRSDDDMKKAAHSGQPLLESKKLSSAVTFLAAPAFVSNPQDNIDDESYCHCHSIDRWTDPEGRQPLAVWQTGLVAGDRVEYERERQDDCEKYRPPLACLAHFVPPVAAEHCEPSYAM